MRIDGVNYANGKKTLRINQMMHCLLSVHHIYYWQKCNCHKALAFGINSSVMALYYLQNKHLFILISEQ